MKNTGHDEILGFGRGVHSKDAKSVYYLLTFLSNFAVSTISATYVLFLISQHLDLLQVNLVNLTFMIGVFLFEVPTGALADHFGRRKLVILSYVFLVLAFGVYYFSSGFIMFVLAETIAALAFTCESGALDAWVVDSMDRKNYIGEVDFVFSHASMIGRFASLFGGLLGAYIGSINIRLPLGIGSILSLVSLVVSIVFMHEIKEKRSKQASKGGFTALGKIIRDGVFYGLKHKVILWLILSSVLATFAFQPLNMYWSPRFNTLVGGQVWILGWVWAGMCIFMMTGGFLARQLLKMGKDYMEISLITVIFLVAPIIIASVSNIFYIAISSFLMYEVGRGLYDPIHKSYLNKYISGDHRATVLSFDSMMGRLGAGFGLVILGFVAKHTDIQTAWITAGVILLFLIPIYLRAGYHEKKLQ